MTLPLIDTIPRTSADALREFNERYILAQTTGPAPSWATRFVMSVDAPRVTFPLALMSTKFQETVEQSSHFRTMAEKSFDVTVAEFDAGYEAKLTDVLNAYGYRNWTRIPQKFVDARARFVARHLAALLESGTSALSPYDDVAFFSATHKANPSDASTGAFSNYQSTATDPTDLVKLAVECTAMRFVKDENGDKLGVEPDEIWLPTETFQDVSDALSQANLASGESNKMLGKLKPVHVPELTDPNDFYLADSKMFNAGYDPCLAVDHLPATSLGLRQWDESSDFFKDTGKLKISQHIWHGFALVFPHAIRKVAGA